MSDVQRHRPVCALGDIGRELSDILGIPQLRNVSIHFPLDGVISAEADFLLNEVQAKAIVKLCRDGRWRSNPQSAERD